MAEDERESGRRMLLNLGHTLAHAIESLSGYRGILHGEAVAIGMVFAARRSEALGLCPPGVAGKGRTACSAGLAFRPPSRPTRGELISRRFVSIRRDGTLASSSSPCAPLGRAETVPLTPAEILPAGEVICQGRGRGGARYRFRGRSQRVEDRLLEALAPAGASDEVAALITAGAGNPASPAAVALADAWRRAGRADEAVRVAREALQHQPESMSVRVALALALLDLGKPGEARGELARAFEASPERALGRAALERVAAEAALRRGSAGIRPVTSPPAPAQPIELLEEIGGDEFDRAFDAAESEAEGAIDANQVAEQAIRAVEEGASDDLVFGTGISICDRDDGGASRKTGPRRTRRAPCANAWRQGRTRATHHGPRAPAASDAKARDRARILATLERWLENLRRGAA